MSYYDEHKFNIGDRVVIRYMGQEGVVSGYDRGRCLVSYMTETDDEITETYNEEDLEEA